MKSTDKIIAFLEKYTREEYFQERVKNIRHSMKIPIKGELLPENFLEEKGIDYIALVLGITYKGQILMKLPMEDLMPLKEILDRLPTPFCTGTMIHFLNLYILYNVRDYSLFEKTSSSIHQSVGLYDLRNEYLEIKGCCDCNLKVAENFLGEKSKIHPVIIGISPYATQNEVIDLVKSKWNDIQKIIKDHVNNRDIYLDTESQKEILNLKKRDESQIIIEDIVYENKHLPLKEIGKVIQEKTGKILDQGEIGKIKSLAIQRRKK